MSGTEESKDKGGGWIEWDGRSRERPFDGYMADIRFRDGDERSGDVSGCWWDHFDSVSDIIAYRIHKESAN